MCQPKSQGGRRCQAHLSGSTAAVTQASVVAHVSEASAREVFSDLRKEAKNMELPEVTREEVVSVARNAQLSAQYDETIPATIKRKIIKQWARAMKEALPTRETLYAWKNAIGETLRRNRSRVMALGISGMIAFTAACSGGGGDLPNTTPSSSATPSISASASPSASPSLSSSPVNEGQPVGVEGLVSAGVVEVPGGSYTQVKPSEDSPLFVVDNATVSSEVSAKYSPEQILAAQKFAATFAIQEGVDSSVAADFSSERANEWIDAHQSDFAPGFVEASRTSIQGENAGGFVNAYTNGERGYNLIKNGTPRVADENLRVTGLTLTDQGNIVVSMEGLFIRRGDVTSGDGNEIFSADLKYAVTEVDGEWKIAGWRNVWKGVKPANQ